MKKIAQNLLILFLLSFAGYYVYANYLDSCSKPIAYDIGNIDQRFGITENEFIKLAKETEAVWEKAAGFELFNYDENAEFKINLVFDDRQQRTIDERNSRANIQTQQEIYRSKVASYNTRLAGYRAANEDYEADLAAYDERLRKYNEQVDYWNKNGGAPANEYTALQREKTALQREATRLESVRKSLNQTVTAINALGAEINVAAKDLNLDVDAYNGQFGTTREFDQGSYTGTAINIYQFNVPEDLRLVLAHEYGHALGMEHIDDPYAIMYYLMDKQNLKNLQPSEADINALNKSCNI